MNRILRIFPLAAALVAPAFVFASVTATPSTLADFQALAKSARCSLTLPTYPVTVEEVRAQAENAIKTADAALDAVGSQDPAKLTFDNTFGAFDAITAKVNNVYLVIGTVAESNPDAAIRDAANEMSVKLQSWSVALDYRENLYRVLKAVADTNPKLDREQQRVVDDQMRTYRRAGLSLAPADRALAEKLRKDLTALNTEFAVNITDAKAPLDFTAAELAGMPDSFLESPGVKQPDGRYRVMANVTWHAQAIGENADNAEVRRRVLVARYQLAEKNKDVLKRLVILRADIAHLLGYANWADYQIEVRMAKNATTAVKFQNDLAAGLQPKLDAELAELRAMKIAQTGQADAQLELSDIAYYTNKRTKEKFAVDPEKLRVFFPYQATLEGMFAIYQKIFSLKFTAVKPPYVWAPGVQLYCVQDAVTGRPMGAFYLDMFPREGKFNHFACFDQKLGGVMPDGRYDLPVAALLCNFPVPSPDKPSLLKHAEVEILFHEFGHVMHGMLTRSRYVEQNGANVPLDFVEAPSQMLENWVWDKAVLDTFAADYRDRSKKIPADALNALIAARQATDGYFNRRQLAIGSLDLALHTLSPEEARSVDVVKLTNDVTARVSFPVPPDTYWATYIGHLSGYDAGYYGYLWAKVMSIDMASVFKEAPGGFLDEKVGRRLRDEIYAIGNTRDVGESVEIFLGRPRSMQPFLDYVGIKPAVPMAK